MPDAIRTSSPGIAVAIAVVVMAAGCGSQDERAESVDRSTNPHWTYEGADGPSEWGSLSTEYARCADGTAQSPIAVRDPEPVALADLRFDYQTTTAEVTDTGHTAQVKVPPGSSVVLDEATYVLTQVHFHAPSEHTVADRSFPVEFHFVHRADDGTLAVVGVMAVEGGTNPAWDPVLEALPSKGSATIGALDLASLLPTHARTIRYDGSLTTPPCREGVHWTLLEREIELSTSQIATLTGHYHGNNRPPQPLSGRRVVLDSTAED